MTHADLEVLDMSKMTDKEWFLLRNKQYVSIKAMDDIKSLDPDIKCELLRIQDMPLKGEALSTFHKCMKDIISKLDSGEYRLKF